MLSGTRLLRSVTYKKNIWNQLGVVVAHFGGGRSGRYGHGSVVFRLRPPYHKWLSCRSFDATDWEDNEPIQKNIRMIIKTTVLFMRISSRLNLDGVSNEFWTSLVSVPVKHDSPMAHSVFRRTAPRRSKFSAPNAMSKQSPSSSAGGNVSFPEKVLTCGLGGSDVKTAT